MIPRRLYMSMKESQAQQKRPRPRRWAGRGRCAMGCGGGGGNRTRVLWCETRASPSAVRCAFLGPGGHTDKPPTGSVTVWFPAPPRDRVERLSSLDYARVRDGNAPGLTASVTRSGGEGEAIALGIGDYVLRHVVNEIIAAFLGSLLLIRHPQSKPITPMGCCAVVNAGLPSPAAPPGPGGSGGTPSSYDPAEAGVQFITRAGG
jgi:hypothetical protein